jgi:hypothetical protein
VYGWTRPEGFEWSLLNAISEPMSDELPTARTMATTGFKWHVYCKSCRWPADTDFATADRRRSRRCATDQVALAVWELWITVGGRCDGRFSSW